MDNKGRNGGRPATLIPGALICLAVLALAACGGSYGTLQRSAATDNEFESIRNFR